ncbi:MAG: DUF167 domain-containing protein [Actinobacteria bacterium]|nr:DUF167 domain-containing protein [Actinomycetota bacterium]
MSLAVWVTPGASRSEVAGVADGRLHVRLAAPAQEGRANAELIRLVAAVLGVLRREVELAAGATGRRKLLRVRGVTLEEARRRLRL